MLESLEFDYIIRDDSPLSLSLVAYMLTRLSPIGTHRHTHIHSAPARRMLGRRVRDLARGTWAASSDVDVADGSLTDGYKYTQTNQKCMFL